MAFFIFPSSSSFVLFAYGSIGRYFDARADYTITYPRCLGCVLVSSNCVQSVIDDIDLLVVVYKDIIFFELGFLSREKLPVTESFPRTRFFAFIQNDGVSQKTGSGVISIAQRVFLQCNLYYMLIGENEGQVC